MNRFGKKAGVMGVVLLALALLPVIVAVIFLPTLPETVPMKIDAAGKVLREGKNYELLFAPALCFVLSIATYMSAAKQARTQDNATMASLTCERYLRNGIITAVVLNLATAYLFFMVLTGKGIGF